MHSRLFVCLCVCAALLWPCTALSKRMAPPSPPRAAPTGPSSCADLPGVWTGFEPSGPLYDSYQMSWRPFGAQGAFTAVYVAVPGGEGQGWTLGEGQLSPDNTTCTITFDTGLTMNGKVSDSCSTIMWDNGSGWRKTVALPKKVFMVSMNHLDVGYNGIPGVGLINNVLTMYFTVYFPRAVAIAQALRARNGTERLVYTTHPWLVDLYMDCPANFTLSGVTLACPAKEDQLAFAAAIQSGDVVFHASPFNIQFGGAYNPAMLDAIFQEPKRVADSLGVSHPVVASLRDVPGAPRSLIPALVRNGIPALSIGVNNYAPRPQLPTPCVWLEPNTNTSVVLLMTEQGQGYPNNVGPSPTDPQGLAASYCVSSNASAAVLCWAFRTDNSGPPESVEEVLNQYDIARWQWPGAEVVAGTFDEWWAAFQDAIPSLPVTSLEMGETWLTGFASDGFKNAFYRVAAREYSNCLAAGGCASSDPRISGFLRLLMKMPEHTWGLPSIYDSGNYTNAQFHAARSSGMPTYVNSELSWSEQRDMGTVYAMQALGNHPLAAAITAAAAALTPSLPQPADTGFHLVPSGSVGVPVTITSAGGNVTIAFDSVSGAINTLAFNGTVVADANHVIGQLVYQTVNDSDLDSQHTPVDGMGCCCCYGWSNMQKVANPMSSRTPATLTALWSSSSSPPLAAPVTFLAQLALPSLLHTYYGAPSDVWVNVTVSAAGAVSVEVQLFGKTATRLGEAIYYEFATVTGAGRRWFADVLGEWVDPLDVVVRGSQHQHGVGEGYGYVGGDGSGVWIETVDAPVVSPWTAIDPPSTLIVPFTPLNGPVEGMAAVLFSNIYNTNFPLYSVDDSMKFRFGVSLLGPSEERGRRAAAAATRTQ